MPRGLTCRSIISSIAIATLSGASYAQESTSQLGNVLNARPAPGNSGFDAVIGTASLDIYLQQQSGVPIEGVAVVTLLNLTGQVYRQSTTKEGHLIFSDIAPTEYTIQVVSPAYERAVKQVQAPTNASARVTIMMQPGEGVDIAAALSVAALKPKAQKELAKAMDALRASKADAARSHLDAANRLAPNQAEVAYLFGVYSSQLNDWDRAKEHWMRALALNRQHLRSLLSLAEVSIREKKAAEALDYAKRAVDVASTSWRAHAVLAEAYWLQGARDDTLKEGERALELGHSQAASLEPLLARALAENGNKDRASALLQAYVHDHPSDAAAKKQLESLLANAPAVSPGAPPSAADKSAAVLSEMVLATMGRSTWMPPEIDESVPPVEPGASCEITKVLEGAGQRMEELIRNVNRFTATESVTHESINRRGFASAPETAKFNYLVSIERAQGGSLIFNEYRQRQSATRGYEESVMTDGLPGLVLAFHPYFAKNYAMTCEGLSRWKGQLAWQVHFRQKKDQPNVMRTYRLGVDGPAYPVAMKGRAWIAADTYQVVRMETDLVAPLPEIRLAIDHIAIEYDPVHFRAGAVDLWLPHTADVFYEWKGRREHQRHSFSDYLLFSVDDQQRISLPKTSESSGNGPATPAKPPL